MARGGGQVRRAPGLAVENGAEHGDEGVGGGELGVDGHHVRRRGDAHLAIAIGGPLHPRARRSKRRLKTKTRETFGWCARVRSATVSRARVRGATVSRARGVQVYDTRVVYMSDARHVAAVHRRAGPQLSRESDRPTRVAESHTPPPRPRARFSPRCAHTHDEPRDPRIRERRERRIRPRHPAIHADAVPHRRPFLGWARFAKRPRRRAELFGGGVGGVRMGRDARSHEVRDGDRRRRAPRRRTRGLSVLILPVLQRHLRRRSSSPSSTALEAERSARNAGTPPVLQPGVHPVGPLRRRQLSLEIRGRAESQQAPAEPSRRALQASHQRGRGHVVVVRVNVDVDVRANVSADGPPRARPSRDWGSASPSTPEDTRTPSGVGGRVCGDARAEAPAARGPRRL